MNEKIAIFIGENELWKEMSLESITEYYLKYDKIFTPLYILYKAFAHSFSRPIYTHHLGLFHKELKSEWEEIKKAKNLKIEEPNWDDFR